METTVEVMTTTELSELIGGSVYSSIGYIVGSTAHAGYDFVRGFVNGL